MLDPWLRDKIMENDWTYNTELKEKLLPLRIKGSLIIIPINKNLFKSALNFLIFFMILRKKYSKTIAPIDFPQLIYIISSTKKSLTV